MSAFSVYVPAAKTGQMAVGKVADGKKMTQLAAVGAHCAVKDEHRQVWTCDPQNGKILVMKNTAR